MAPKLVAHDGTHELLDGSTGGAESILKIVHENDDAGEGLTVERRLNRAQRAIPSPIR
jgi:hypothetical protein